MWLLKQHTYMWPGSKVQSLSKLSGCGEFIRKTVIKKARTKECVRGCQLCTSWKHMTADCHQNKNRIFACSVESEGSRCKMKHHKCLHIPSLVDCQAAGTTSTHVGTKPRKEHGGQMSSICWQLIKFK